MDEACRTNAKEGFAAPFGYTRLLGTYLAVNAVPDLWLLVDSADCASIRAELIHDNHDWRSTLIAADGRFRVAASGFCPTTIILDRRAELAEMVAAIGSGDGWGLLICPSPTASLVGVDYSAVVRSVEARLRMKALVLSPLESVGDWCAGYAQVMELLAERIDLPPRPGGPDPETVAIVGYLWDRNEADHSASVAECVRLLGAIGLRTSSVWFSGCPAASLSAVSEAGTIVALPYGGQAAEILAGRTGASVVRLGLPVGFDGTARWLLELGERTGRSSQAAACVEREAARAYDLAAKAVTRHFLGRDFAICTETVLAGALAGMVRELGGSVRLLAGAGSPAVELPPDAADRVLLDGNMEELRSALRQVVAASQTIPVLVGNERAIALVESPGLAVVPMGFRSGGIHYLHGTPFLGFEGALSLVDRIGNAIALKEMLLG